MYGKLLNLNLLLVFVVIGVLFFGNSTEAARLGMSVSPQIFELDVFPGESISQKIKVGNLSEVAMPITVRVVDFTAEENSGEMLFDEVSQDPSIASRKWFEIENPDLILEPEERREVKFSINVPENAEPGGHYSIVIFEPRLPSFYFEPYELPPGFEEWTPAPRAIPVVGVLFLLSVKTLSLEPEIQQKLEIVEFSLPKEERILVLENIFSKIAANIAQAAEFTITEKPPSKFILRIKNNDIYHIKPFGKVLIYNIFGKKVGETEIPKRTVLPGKTRAFPVEFSPEIPAELKWLPASISNFLVQNFFVGKYQAKLELQPNAPAVLTFFSFPWKFWLSFILIFGLLIFSTLKYRKRIKAALKILLSKPKYRG